MNTIPVRIEELVGMAFRAYDGSPCALGGMGVGGVSCYGLVHEVYRRMGMELAATPKFLMRSDFKILCGRVLFDRAPIDGMVQAGDIIVEDDLVAGGAGGAGGGDDEKHVSVAIDVFTVVESVRGVGVRKAPLSAKRRLGRMRYVLRPFATLPAGATPEQLAGMVPVVTGPVGDFNTAILLAIAVASMVASRILTPRARLAPNGSDKAEGQRYGFSRYTRDAIAGEPIDVVLGRLARYGGKLIAANPTTEDDQGNSRLRMLVCFGEGEVSSLAGRTSDFDAVDAATLTGLYVNDQPAANFVGIKAWGRMGTSGQGPIPGFDDTEVPREVGVGGVVLRNTDGVERTGGSASAEAYTFRTTLQVNAAVVRIRFSQGLYSLAGETAQLEPRTVKWRLRTRPVVSGTPGSWSGWTVVTVSRAERAEFFASRRLDGLADPAEVQDIQVERVSVESADASASDTMLWDAAVEVVYAENTYAGFALLALEISAGEQINGSAPRVSVAIDGVKVRVWDGVSDPSTPTFTTTWSDNPADHALEVLTNTVWGMGATYGDADIDMASLLAWRTHCAESVDRPATSGGGIRARYTHNRALSNDADGVEVLRSICALGHAVPVRVGGRWAFVVDRAQGSPVEVFTDGSVAAEEGGIATLEYSRKLTTGGAAPNRFVVQFENAGLNGDADTAGYPNPGEGWLAGEQLREQSVRVDGLTDPDQAAAEAVYRAKAERLRTRAVRFTTTRPLVTVQPGERFDLAMSLPGWGLSSGRVRAGCTVSAVVLDETIVLEVGTAYEVTVVHSDGSTETRAIASGAGTYAPGAAIAVSPDFSQAPAAYAEYALGGVGVVTKPFLCESVALTEGLVWEVRGLEYVEAVYDASDAVPVEIRYSTLAGNLAAPGPVLDIRAAERRIDGRLRVELSWSQTADDRRRSGSYRIFRRVVGTTTWQTVPNPTVTTNGAAIDITEGDRAYEFCVVAVSVAGAALSPYDPSVPIATLVMGLAQTPPPPPTGLTAENTEGNTYRLFWDAVEGATSYAVLAGGDATGLPMGGAEDCVVMARVTDPEITGLELAPGVAVTFWVRSVNASGRLSFTAASVTVATPATPPGKSIRGTRTFDLSTEGTLTNLSWTGDRLRLTNANNPGVWLSPWEDLSTATLSELTLRPGTANDATDPAINTDPFTAPSIAADQWGLVDDSPMTIGMLFPPWPDREQRVSIEVRTNDGVVDSDWAPLAWCGSIERTLRKYQVRVTLARDNPPYRPALRSLVAVVTD